MYLFCLLINYYFCQTQFQFTSPVPVELRLAWSLIITTPTATHPPGKVEMQLEIDHINGQSCRHTKFQNRSTFPSWPSAGIRGWKTNGMGRVGCAGYVVGGWDTIPKIMPLRGPTYKLSFSVFQLSWNCKLGRVWQYLNFKPKPSKSSNSKFGAEIRSR